MSTAAGAGNGTGGTRRLLSAGVLLTAIAALAALAVLCCVFVIDSDVSAEPVTEGPCGDGVTWAFNPDTGEMIISGEGPLEDLSSYRLLWGEDKLKAVVIEEGVTSIGGWMFEYFSSLTSVKIPSSVGSIRASAFTHCENLTDIEVAEDNPYYYSSKDGVLFKVLDGGKTELASYPAGKEGSYTVSDVTSIGVHAFSYSKLTSVKISEGVMSISIDAFYECRLTSLTIPSSVTEIDRRPFLVCKNLVNIDVIEGNPKYFSEGVPFSKFSAEARQN